MKNISILSNLLFCSIILLSCETEQNDKKTETPKPLRDEEISVSSYRRTGGLTEELYQELVEKDSALKKLEAEISDFNPKPIDLKSNFNSFDSKSNNYYGSANYYASQFSDSSLKKKIIALISRSTNNYDNKISDHNTLLKQISRNESTLKDHHLALKIVLTMPIIEKYQSENIPEKKQFKVLINEQNKLIEKVDKLTPSY